MQGPFELRQGDTGLVVRSPIFLAERFIGLAIGVYDVPVLVKESLAGVNSNQFAFRLADGEGRIFFGPDMPFQLCRGLWHDHQKSVDSLLKGTAQATLEGTFSRVQLVYLQYGMHFQPWL